MVYKRILVPVDGSSTSMAGLKGTHGRRGVNRLVLGSDAELVVRNAPVPVLLVRSARRG